MYKKAKGERMKMKNEIANLVTPEEIKLFIPFFPDCQSEQLLLHMLKKRRRQKSFSSSFLLSIGHTSLPVVLHLPSSSSSLHPLGISSKQGPLFFFLHSAPIGSPDPLRFPSPLLSLFHISKHGSPIWQVDRCHWPGHLGRSCLPPARYRCSTDSGTRPRYMHSTH